MKKKAKIISLIVIGVLTILYFKPFSRPEIVVLDNLTEDLDGTINQICFVKNHPSNSKKLFELITEFNLKNKTKNRNYSRLFIKQHDYAFLPALTLAENIDYTSNEVTRDDLDNIDFLGSSYSYLTKSGKRVTTLDVNVVEIWYYKE